MKSVERPWDWWAYHYRVVHRSQIAGIREWDEKLVELIVEVLELEPGDRVLDLASGSGDHARLLAARGMDVVGIEIAPSLVEYARQQAAAQGLKGVEFRTGDMRTIDQEDEFDAVLVLSGSFGFFDDATNEDVLRRIARALKRDGGRVLIDVFDPAQMVVRPARRTWSYYGGGYGLRTVWWEPETCTYVSEFMFVDDEGVLNTAGEPERIRVYSLPEWRRLFHDAGLVLTRALADTSLPLVPYDREHYGNLVIVGQRVQ
ncbi:MAG: class I SAM-dependent methyltransferase [Anaerolineae bacterium]|nr:class I SAM-dependent methyltransferase [Anaerolineae bacterium]